jgi:flavin reductase (DIM6/NTAB) family NADH-FMN oxidoreductase RutF
MVVLTTAADGERAGCLVGFFTQCSIDPVRFLVCVSVRNHTHRVVAAANTVAVQALAADQYALAELFGGSSGDLLDKFARCEWTPGPHGVPLLSGCPEWLVGDVLDRIELGDHTGVLIAPTAAGRSADRRPPLLLSAVLGLTPGHSA